MFRTSLINTEIDLSATKSEKGQTELELRNLDGTVVNQSSYSEPLKVQLMNLQVDLARALTINKEEHPSVKSIRDNIRQINEMLRDSMQQHLEIKNMIQNPIKTQLVGKLVEENVREISLETRIASLRKVIANLEQEILPDTVDEKQQQLLRNRDLVFMTITHLNSKLLDAQSAANGNLSRFTIIDEPLVPKEPANKGMLFFILAGLGAGLCLASGSIFVFDLLDNRLSFVSDYERFYPIPMLGIIPNKRDADNYADLFSPEASRRRANELGEIMINIKYLLNNGKKLFSLCSPIRHEGKSIISLNLAAALAGKG